MSIVRDQKSVPELAVTRRVLVPPPAVTLADAFRLCDPFTPLDPQLDESIHADLSAIRGGNRLAKIVRSIQWSGGVPTLHFVGGHLGGGKTTELLRMKEELEASKDPSGSSALTTVLFLDADRKLNRNDVELEDILVALWELIYEHAPEAAAQVLAPLWKKQVVGAVSELITNLPAEVPALRRWLDRLGWDGRCDHWLDAPRPGRGAPPVPTRLARQPVPDRHRPLHSGCVCVGAHAVASGAADSVGRADSSSRSMKPPRSGDPDIEVVAEP